MIPPQPTLLITAAGSVIPPALTHYLPHPDPSLVPTPPPQNRHYTPSGVAVARLAKSAAREAAAGEVPRHTFGTAYIRTHLVDAQSAGQARARGISEDEVIDGVMLAPMPKKAFI